MLLKIISCILYTIGAALEAGSVSYGMIVAARVILGIGVGLEGGTVPVYVAETVERRLRGNMVSLYQFNIALGEVLGYAIAAIFLRVPGNWRYILGSSLVFSTIMLIGLVFFFFPFHWHYLPLPGCYFYRSHHVRRTEWMLVSDRELLTPPQVSSCIKAMWPAPMTSGDVFAEPIPWIRVRNFLS